MTAVELIRCYRNVHARALGTERRRPHKDVPADLETARKFLQRCAAIGADPARMFELRFQEVQKIAGPRAFPRFGSLWSEAVAAQCAREATQAAVAATETAPCTQVVRDLSQLSPAHEAVRRTHHGKAWLCLTDELSGGFDPRSAHCPSCPVGAECRSRQIAAHGFDVAALRAGDLHKLPTAVRAALRGWNGGI